MSREVIDFSDTETALVTVQAMTATLDEVLADNDPHATLAMYAMLADAFSGVTGLIQRLGAGLGHVSLGASFPPDRWKDLSPDNIIRDLENLVLIEELGIEIKQAKLPGSGGAEAKRLSQEITRSIKTLKSKVINAKAWIQKYWPDAWTEKEESDFQRWL